MRSRFLFTTALLFIYLWGSASSPINDVDSIKNLMGNSLSDHQNPDTSYVNKLNNLADRFFHINPDSTYYYGNKSIQLSRKLNYGEGIAGGLLQLGHVNSLKGKSDEAKAEFAEAEFIYKGLNDKKGLIATYISFGRLYNQLADYKLALNYLKQAVKISGQIKDEKSLVDAEKNTGIGFYDQGKLPEALDHYYKALFIAVNNHYMVLSGEIYNDIGVVLQAMEVYPKALEYFNKALNIVQKENDIQGIGTMHENIGEVMIAQNDYAQAITHLAPAVKIARAQGDIDGLTSLYTDLGMCYAHTGQMAKAIKYLDTSLQISGSYKFVFNQAYAQIGLATVYNMQKDYANAYKYASAGQALTIKSGNLSVRANAALQLNKALAGLGRFEDAYKSLNQYIDLKNQLKNNLSIQKLTSYNYELDFAAKERAQVQQQKEHDLIYQQKIQSQRLINIIFSIVILAMIVTSVVYYKQKRKQQKINRMLEDKNEEVLSQKENIDEQAQKLNDLNILKDRLISVLAHDLRAPLSTLRGLFSLLQDESITHQQMIEMIPNVLKKLEYTSDFLDTLLFWINSQMENFDSSVKSFLVKEIVAYEVESYQDQANLKGISLIDNVPNDLLALADPNSIRIVVRNLVTNALKFSGEHDTIEVFAGSKDDDTIIIKVKDSGIGIPPDQLKKLFKSKVDSGTGTQQESGTGMGLLFCKDLVEKCNGKIWVTSKQGIGTEFSFTIPADANLVIA